MCFAHATQKRLAVSECLGCQRCETGPMVTLSDGRSVCNFCEDYREECEARHVISLPSKYDRREYIDGITKKRGEAAGLRLAEVVKKLWEIR